MTPRFEAWLNNQNLTEVDRRIRLTGIVEAAPKEKDQTSDYEFRSGTLWRRRVRKSLTVSLSFVIAERDMDKQNEVLERVLLWARDGGWLTVRGKPGKRLRVEAAALTVAGNPRKWTDTATLTLTAYAMPYWEQEAPTTATIATAGTTGSAMLLAPGNAGECLTDAEIKAVGGTVNTLTVTVGNTNLVFASLGLAVGSVLKIGHGDDGLLSVKVGTTSKLAKRAAASEDDLLAAPGRNVTVAFSANATCTAVFRTRGRWV